MAELDLSTFQAEIRARRDAEERALHLLARHQAGGLTNPVQGGTSGLWYHVKPGYETFITVGTDPEVLPFLGNIWARDLRPEPGVLCASAHRWNGAPTNDILLGSLVQLRADELGILKELNWFTRHTGGGDIGGFLESAYFRNATVGFVCRCGHGIEAHTTHGYHRRNGVDSLFCDCMRFVRA